MDGEGFRPVHRDKTSAARCSWSQGSPDGGRWAFVGRHGAINPAGRVRSFNTNALIGDEPRARQLGMERDYLLLKPASASRPSGEWNDDDYDILADGVVVGRIFKVHAAPVGQPWMWTLAFGHHEDRTPTHGYAATREGAMTAFAKSWRRE